MADSGDRKLKASLAEAGVEMLLKMVFVDNFWHGDLHPGNILVTSEGKLAVVDTGIVGSLGLTDRQNILETFTAILAGDGTRQTGPLSLVKECRCSSLIGRELQSVACASNLMP